MTCAERPTILLRPAIPYSQEYGAAPVIRWAEPATRYDLVMIGGGSDDRRLQIAMAIIADCYVNVDELPAGVGPANDNVLIDDSDDDDLEDDEGTAPHLPTDELCYAAGRPLIYPFRTGRPVTEPFDAYSALAIEDALAVHRVASWWIAERYDDWAAART